MNRQRSKSIQRKKSKSPQRNKSLHKNKSPQRSKSLQKNKSPQRNKGLQKIKSKSQPKKGGDPGFTNDEINSCVKRCERARENKKCERACERYDPQKQEKSSWVNRGYNFVSGGVGGQDPSPQNLSPNKLSLADKKMKCLEKCNEEKEQTCKDKCINYDLPLKRRIANNNRQKEEKKTSSNKANNFINNWTDCSIL